MTSKSKPHLTPLSSQRAVELTNISSQLPISLCRHCNWTVDAEETECIPLPLKSPSAPWTRRAASLTPYTPSKLWAVILCSFQCMLHDPQLGMHTHWRSSLYPASKAKIKIKNIIISLKTTNFFLLEPQCVVTGTMTHGWIQQVYKPKSL